uniref:Putative secreted peptide n=1 Tax=Anopheles braziliensis TaxID=58242 RepID=A0A2M3ZP13_9DIPT
MIDDGLLLLVLLVARTGQRDRLHGGSSMVTVSTNRGPIKATTSFRNESDGFAVADAAADGEGPVLPTSITVRIVLSSASNLEFRARADRA